MHPDNVINSDIFYFPVYDCDDHYSHFGSHCRTTCFCLLAWGIKKQLKLLLNKFTTKWSTGLKRLHVVVRRWLPLVLKKCFDCQCTCKQIQGSVTADYHILFSLHKYKDILAC